MIHCEAKRVSFLDTSTGTGCTAASLSEHKWSPREGREGEGGSAREVVSCLTPHMRRRRDGILSEATALRASRLCSNALQTVRMVGRFTASPGRPRSKRRRHHSNPKRSPAGRAAHRRRQGLGELSPAQKDRTAPAAQPVSTPSLLKFWPLEASESCLQATANGQVGPLPCQPCQPAPAVKSLRGAAVGSDGRIYCPEQRAVRALGASEPKPPLLRRSLRLARLPGDRSRPGAHGLAPGPLRGLAQEVARAPKANPRRIRVAAPGLRLCRRGAVATPGGEQIYMAAVSEPKTVPAVPLKPLVW